MTAFCPASITAFFSTSISEKPDFSGSYGVGFTINRGVFVDVSQNEDIEIVVNGEKFDFPTVRYLVNKLIGEGVRVNVKMDLPLSCGFGMSGATALATALAINKFFGLERSFLDLADLSHESEVVNKTGLGDVVCQTYGGLIVRLNARCPSKAVIERYLISKELDFLVMGKISTQEVLKDELARKRINKVGKECLKEFLKNPSFENLFNIANKFSIETELMDGDIKDVIEAVESDNGKAAMIMLGKAVFAYNGFNALKEFGKPFKAKISCYSACFV